MSKNLKYFTKKKGTIYLRYYKPRKLSSNNHRYRRHSWCLHRLYDAFAAHSLIPTYTQCLNFLKILGFRRHSGRPLTYSTIHYIITQNKFPRRPNAQAYRHPNWRYGTLLPHPPKRNLTMTTPRLKRYTTNYLHNGAEAHFTCDAPSKREAVRQFAAHCAANNITPVNPTFLMTHIIPYKKWPNGTSPWTKKPKQ